MFSSTSLEIAIGLILFFLIASLLCAAIREAIELLLKSRARDLERGLRNMLADERGDGVTKDVLNHDLISSLSLGTYDPTRLEKIWLRTGAHLPPSWRTGVPSYIPSRQFATALLDIVTKEKRPENGGAPDAKNPMDRLRACVDTIDNPRVKSVLTTAIDAAGQDIAKVRDEIEVWFDTSMEQVTGWYKQRTQMILFWLGLGVAALLNLDALTVAARLSTDPALRALAVAQAQEAVDDDKLRSRLAATAAGGGPAPVAEETLEQERKKAFQDAKEDLARAKQIVGQVGYPIGWSSPDESDPGVVKKACENQGKDVNCKTPAPTWMDIFQKLIGWLITAMAVTLGAPFWFDLLNRFMALRSTPKPPPSPATGRR